MYKTFVRLKLNIYVLPIDSTCNSNTYILYKRKYYNWVIKMGKKKNSNKNSNNMNKNSNNMSGANSCNENSNNMNEFNSSRNNMN